ncbi:pRiA4b ORF-3-like protein [Quadrisphaera granulorum]|uniref:PRiA4b ORF-3-like protein n=1 Tax=Quadrisphaera granulorum TaxID=317664 RepID=A0A316AAL8_9ACTN|nr:plasmid pRiA4b ORF-3 family protein [Quadrisphaera granulorum]PWJ46857.1 pRiA4b ORF-3-like protein [Quadrisphaera granulorum]SZE99024.1 pRiA4b ORF-3-like protein [Quadrisphaera granulorum]
MSKTALLAEGTTVELRVELLVESDEMPARPWRTLRLASEMPLAAVHSALQAAFGWTDSHLHRFYLGTPFSAGTQWFGSPTDVAEDDLSEGIDETSVVLGDVLTQPGDELHYVYDLGDNWDHLVQVLDVTPRPAGAAAVELVAGDHAAPEEDSRGSLTWDAEDWAANGMQPPTPPPPFDLTATRREVRRALVAADARPRLDEVAFPVTMFLTQLRGPGSGLVQWRLAEAGVVPSGPLAAGPLDDLDDLDDDAVRAAVHPWAAMLDVVQRAGAEGLTLTAAGYLPPAAVVELISAADPLRRWIGAANREDLTPPVGELRADTQALKLLRVAKGRLLLTPAGRRAAADPRTLLTHVLERMPVSHTSDEHDAGMLALIAVATGRVPLAPGVRHGEGGIDLLSAGMDSIGWSVGGRSLTADHLKGAARPTLVALERLGALRRPEATPWDDPNELGPAAVHLARRALREWPPR